MDQSDWRPMRPTELKTAAGKSDVVPELLDFDSIGDDRFERYFNTNYGEDADYLNVKRSEDEKKGGVSLENLEALAESVQADNKRFVDRAVSLDDEFLSARYGGIFVYTVPELERELKDLNKEIGETNLGDAIKAKIPIGKKKPTKKTIVAAVIEARKLLIQHDNQWVTN